MASRAPSPTLHAALQAAGVPSVELRLPRTDHAFDLFLPEVSPTAQTAMYDVDRFLALMAAAVEWKNTSCARRTATVDRQVKGDADAARVV